MRISLMLLLLCVFITSAQAQTTVVQPSPEAAGATKYADCPVSLYTGTAQINIPLYTLKGTDLSLPISLSYHTSGIKVNEFAGTVGLGWKLNAGGMITRVVRGKPDEDPNGFCGSNGAGLLAQYYLTYKQTGVWNSAGVNFGNLGVTAPNGSNNQDVVYSYEEKVAAGDVDSEPDIFYYVIPGITGKFVIDTDGGVMKIPNTPVIITPAIGSQVGTNTIGGNAYWILTNTDGVKYYFGYDNQNAVEETKYTTSIVGSNNSYTSPEITYKSTWYLNKIESPRGDIISLEYEKVGMFGYSDETQIKREYLNSDVRLYSNGGSYYEYLGVQNSYGPQPNIEYRNVNVTITNQVQLKKIYAGLNTVEFSYTLTRRDNPNGGALEYIDLVSNTAPYTRINLWKFNYDYFPYAAGCSETAIPVACHRLQLKSLTQFNSNGSIPPYVFTYNTTNIMPKRKSYQQDHWGYFNNNTVENLIPTGTYNGVTYNGANREPSESLVSTFSLIQITYPSGGSTLFEYESNKIPLVGGGFQYYGGQRVKTVKEYDPVSNRYFNIKNYTYADATVNTNFSYNYLSSWYNIIVLPPGLVYHLKHYYFTRISRSIQETGTTDGNALGYGTVREDLGTIGYTVYKFTNQTTNPDRMITQWHCKISLWARNFYHRYIVRKISGH